MRAILNVLWLVFGGIWLAVVALRPAPPNANPAAAGAAPKSPRPARPSRARRPRSSGESLSQRMEERWRRRRESGDF